MFIIHHSSFIVLRKRAWLAPFLAASCALASRLDAQNAKLTASSLPEFLARYEQSLGPVDSAFADLANENLPLLDESGKPLGRRNIRDRRKTVADLRDTVKRLAASPQDLVLTMTLFNRTETLADDLYNLSQIAYDNDREELGNHLTDLLATVDQNQDLIESYALSVATEKQKRILELEKENRDLQEKLKEAAKRPKKLPR